MSKTLKGIDINTSWHSITIYKSFVRSHLQYSVINYDQPNNGSLNQKLKRIQYNADLAIIGAIKGASQSKLCNKQGFKSLKFRC